MANFLNELKDNFSSVTDPNQILNKGVDKQRTAFLKGLKSTSSGQKEDPTYTGFRIMFDFGYGGLVDPSTFLPISPLLSKGKNNDGKTMKDDGATDFFHLSRQNMNIGAFPNYTENLHYMTAEGYLRERRSASENGEYGGSTDNTGRRIVGGEGDRFQSGVSHRAAALSSFRNLLSSINEKSPWFIQSIAGLDKVLGVDQQRQIESAKGREQRSGVLTFECIDSIDLRINAMAELYRKATYDYQYHRQLLPDNLRKFRMYIIVTEIRQMDLQKNLADVLNPFNIPGVRNAVDSIRDIAQSAGILRTTAPESTNAKTDLESFVKSFEKLEPYILIYQLDLCEFNFDQSYPFTTLSNSVGPGAPPVKNTFKVHVGSAKEYKLQYNILSDLIRNESTFAPILIQDSWNLAGSHMLQPGGGINNNLNVFKKLASNFITNSIASVVQQQVSPIVTKQLLGNAYGFRLSDAVRSLNSVQDMVSGIKEMKDPFGDYRPQSRGLGGPGERQYPTISEDLYPNNNPNNAIGAAQGNVFPSSQNPGSLGPSDVYPTNPGSDAGLPNRTYPVIKDDEYRNVGGDLSGKDLGVPDRKYTEIKDDIYKGSPGEDLGLPRRIYGKIKDDSYPNIPGKDLGLPDRKYPDLKEDVYPNDKIKYGSIKEKSYPENSTNKEELKSDVYENTEIEYGQIDERMYKEPVLNQKDISGEDLYKESPGKELGLPKRMYPKVEENVYKTGS
jgi:hypothetical protein